MHLYAFETPLFGQYRSDYCFFHIFAGENQKSIIMNKKIILFVSCLLLALIGQTSIQVERNNSNQTGGPKRESSFEIVTVAANQQTCELYVTFLQNIPNVRVSLTKNGITYEENGLNAVFWAANE